MSAHLHLTVLVTLNVISVSLGEKLLTTKSPIAINDVLYLDSKDVLLQMLEKKLKEIKDHKKRKSDSRDGNGDFLPKNVDFKLKSNGISAVGDADLLLRYGKNGHGAVNLTSDGISNVGRVQLTVSFGENGFHIPGLGNLFSGPSLKSEDKNDQEQQSHINVLGLNSGFRRQSNNSNITNIADAVEDAVDDNEAKKDDDAINATVTSSTSISTVSSANIATEVVTLNANNAVTSSVANVAANINSPAVSSNTVINSDSAVVAVTRNVQNINAV